MSFRPIIAQSAPARPAPSVPVVPSSFFSVVLGLAGLGSAWQVAHRLWNLPASVGEALMAAAVLVWVLLIVLYAAQWLWAREYALREIEDPIECCFVGLIGVSTFFVALAALPYSRPAAEVLGGSGALLTLGFAVWRTGRLWCGGSEDASITPVLYLPTVSGAFVTATVAGAFGLPDWGQLAFGAGLFSWLAIESVLLHRLYTVNPLPEVLRPTLGIQLVPPTVGTLAFLAVTGGPPGLPAHALLGYGLLQMLVLLRLLPWVARQSFAASYWGFSIGATALSTATLRMVERGDTSAVALLAAPLFVAANVVIAVLTIGMVRLIAHGQLLPRLVPTSQAVLHLAVPREDTASGVPAPSSELHS